MMKTQKYDIAMTNRLWKQNSNGNFYRQKEKKKKSDTQRLPPYVGRRVHLQEVGSQIRAQTHKLVQRFEPEPEPVMSCIKQLVNKIIKLIHAKSEINSFIFLHTITTYNH